MNLVKRFFPSFVVYGVIVVGGLAAGYGVSKTSFAGDGRPVSVEVKKMRTKSGCSMHCSCGDSCKCTDCVNGGCAAPSK